MKNQNAFQKFAAVPHSVWVVMFIAAPLLFVIGFAFRGADGSFSLSNITELAQYGNVFVLSISRHTTVAMKASLKERPNTTA